jgi:hypothetical protein
MNTPTISFACIARTHNLSASDWTKDGENRTCSCPCRNDSHDYSSHL